MTLPHWTDSDIATACAILRSHTVADYSAALASIRAGTGKPNMTEASLRAVFRRRKLAPPTSHCREAVATSSPTTEAHDYVAELVKLTKKKPVTFEELCDKLDLSPTATRRVMADAQARGVAVRTSGVHVGIKHSEPDGRVHETHIEPTAGKRQKIAVISDTHLGSKYCLRAQLREFILYAYAQGVREVLHPGDVLDGCYRHGTFELTHSGIDEQTRDLFETLPRKPGLTYHGITGNHDDTFSDAIGIDAGLFMQRYFEERGRNDLKFYGRRGAYLRMRGATIEMWHPMGGGSYALTYKMQNHVRDYPVGAKPDVLLIGHFHTWVYAEMRGVHGLQCGTFQGTGSAFGKALGGAPSMGGTILSWESTADGTLRRFQVERSAYYEHERPRDIAVA
jgi:predicted phosphodiesterase